MNYRLIYDQIIKNRMDNPIDGYTEKHHILPKSLGGSDEKANLVSLSAREHFICHYLLTKIYENDLPSYKKMIKAFMLMLWYNSDNQVRYVPSRIYEKQRGEFAKHQKERFSGTGNPHYGTKWIYSIELRKSKKIPKDEDIPVGWYLGRILNFDKAIKTCPVCDSKFASIQNKHCSTACSKITIAKVQKNNSFLYGRESELRKYYKETGSMNASLKRMGISGAVGAHYYAAKDILDDLLPS